MLRTPWKCTKNHDARAQPLFRSLNLLFVDVLVAVVVVVCLSSLVSVNHDGNGNENVTKQKVQWVEQWLCTCVINRCTFLSRPLGTKNVRRQSSAYFGGRKRPQLIFSILIWNSTLAFSSYVFWRTRNSMVNFSCLTLNRTLSSHI